MTTTPTTPLEESLTRVVRLLTTARSVSSDPSLVADLQEVELTIHEVLEIAVPAALPEGDITTAHTALTAAEAELDALPRAHRLLWLLPLRAELAILRRRSVA